MSDIKHNNLQKVREDGAQQREDVDGLTRSSVATASLQAAAMQCFDSAIDERSSDHLISTIETRSSSNL